MSDITHSRERQLDTGPERLDNNQLQQLIVATSSETKGLTMGLLYFFGADTSGSLNTTLKELMDQTTIDLGASQFSSSYLAEICKQLIGPGVVEQVKGESRFTDPHRYYLTEAGEKLFLPFAGAVLDWSLRNNCNLRELWREPRMPLPGDVAGTVGRLAVLGRAVFQPLDTQNYTSLEPEYTYHQAEDLLAFLAQHPYAQPVDSHTFILKPEHHQAILELAVILERAMTLDPEFYEEGKVLMESLLVSPDSVATLVKMSFEASHKLQQTRTNYAKFTAAIHRLIEAEGTLELHSLTSTLREAFPELTKDQVHKLSRKIRAGGIDGVACLKTGDRTGIVYKSSNFTPGD